MPCVSTCMALLKAINMGVPIQFTGVARRRRKGKKKGRKGKVKGRKGKEKGRKRKEKKKKNEEERKNKEEKEGVSRSEQTQTAKNSELCYKRYVSS